MANTKAFPDFRLIIDHLLADGNQVVFRRTFTGTHRGPLADTAASGRQVSVPRGIGIFRIDAGKVDQGHLAWDKYALLQQLGVLPMNPSAGAQVSAST